MAKRDSFVLVLALLVVGGVFAQEYTVFYSGECQGSITITKDARGKITIIPKLTDTVDLTHDLCPLVPEGDGFTVFSFIKDIVIDGNTTTTTRQSGDWTKRVVNGNTTTGISYATKDGGFAYKEIVDGNTTTMTFSGDESWFSKTVINGNTTTKTFQDGSWLQTVIDGNTTTRMHEDGWFWKQVVNKNTTIQTWRNDFLPVRKTVVDKQGNNIYIRITTTSNLVRSGNTYSDKKDYDRAIADYTQALQLNPFDTLTYYFRGIVYEMKGDYDRAIADYTEAIRIDLNYDKNMYNKHGSMYNSRGDAYYNKGDYDRSIADYTEAIRLDPNNADARNGFERAQTARGY
jgi:hypothetical protein